MTTKKSMNFWRYRPFWYELKRVGKSVTSEVGCREVKYYSRMTGEPHIVPGQKSAWRRSPLISSKPVSG
jgi:hypothetical protein